MVVMRMIAQNSDQDQRSSGMMGGEVRAPPAGAVLVALQVNGASAAAVPDAAAVRALLAAALGVDEARVPNVTVGAPTAAAARRGRSARALAATHRRLDRRCNASSCRGYM